MSERIDPRHATGPTIPDEAVEAAGAALHLEACTDDDHEACDSGDWDREAYTALTAALSILHPTIPNTIEALGALPADSVIRGDGKHGAFTAVCVRWSGVLLWLTDNGEEWDTEGLVTVAVREDDITEWTVLWPLGGAA